MGLAWLLPGAAFLPSRRYSRFAAIAVLVWLTFALGIALQGAYRWPQPADLEGLDGLAALMFRAGALAKMLPGGPYLFARLFGDSPSFLEGCVNEYGTTLLAMAGLFNLMGIANYFETRKAGSR
jgi:hypothetical protein